MIYKASAGWPHVVNSLKKLQIFMRKIHEKSKPVTIIVEGNIGSGKTTFIQHFKNNKNILTLGEPVEAWKNVQGYNLFNMMYKNRNQWAFIFEMYVQLSMIKIHAIKTTKPLKMLERSIYSAQYCFVENLHNEGMLSDVEFIVLKEWFEWLRQREEVTCDLIVYLRTDPDVAYERIKLRNCEEEKNMEREYVEKMHVCHENWLYYKKKFKCPSKVLVLDANNDKETIKEEFEAFLRDFSFKNILETN